MHAVRTSQMVRSQQGETSLDFYHLERPEPASSQVVIVVTAAGVNRADLLQAAGKYPPPSGANNILGLECGGTISSVGQLTYRFSPGDDVVALLDCGGYAEYVAVSESLALPTPKGWEGPASGGLMEAACTAWSNLVQVGQLHAGDTVLIHGASGGVGTFAVQLAKALGATVIATSRTAARAARCTALGADHSIAYGEFEDFPAALPDVISNLTQGRGVDVVLDVLGGQFLPAHVECLAMGGRLVTIGLQRGARGQLDLGTLLARRASVHGTTLRSRPLAEKAEIVQQVHDQVWPLLEQGLIKPVIERTYRLDEAEHAHEHLASGEVFGKLILLPHEA